MKARALGRCAVLLAIAFGGAALAHRAPGSLSTVEFNPRSGNTEIVHRLHSHDAELGVGAVLDKPNLSVATLEGRSWIALYVEQRFGIESEEGPLPLSLVGAEVAADYILVYQEFPGRLPDVLYLRDDILRDAFPEQINRVNVERDGAVRSVIFARDDGWHRLELRPAER